MSSKTLLRKSEIGKRKPSDELPPLKFLETTSQTKYDLTELSKDPHHKIQSGILVNKDVDATSSQQLPGSTQAWKTKHRHDQSTQVSLGSSTLQHVTRRKSIVPGLAPPTGVKANLHLPPLRPPTCAKMSPQKRTPAQQRRLKRFSQRQSAYKYMNEGWSRWNERLSGVRSYYLQLLYGANKKPYEDEGGLFFDNKGFINRENQVENHSELKRQGLRRHTDDDQLGRVWWDPEDDSDVE